GASHVVAGLAGGGVVLLGGYTYYHMSGVKTVVDNAKAFKSTVVDAKNKMMEKAPEPGVVMQYLRSTAKSYAAFVPGAGQYVDSSFDALDQLQETHGEEVNKITTSAYNELRDISNQGSLDAETAQKVFAILKKHILQLQDLASRAGADILGPILEKHPEIKEKIGGSYSDLKELAAKRGPEAKKIYDDAIKQIKAIFDEGFTADSVQRAQKLIRDTTEKVQGLGDKASKEAWDKAVKQAGPYLEKLPEIKDLLNQKAATLMASGGSAQEIWKQVKEVADGKGTPSKEKIDQLKGLISQKAKEAEESTGASLDGAWEKIEGFDLQKILQDGGEDASRLAKETYDEIAQVLEKKAKEAQKLTEKTKKETKGAANK
ncbi:hypothetical protein SISSUDRAFT_981752, partial [Sistotremastrum suecicum HHB10207 ss-3]